MSRFTFVLLLSVCACGVPSDRSDGDAGTEVCPSDTESCGGECVDTDSDPANCGGCGTACAGARSCRQGQCVDDSAACSDGLPGAWSTVPAERGPSRMVSGDFDGDGFDDFAVLNRDSHSVTVALGAGSGQFVATNIATTREYPRYMTSGDVDGDGHLDLIYSAWEPDGVATLLNDGSGGFTPGPELDVPASADQVAAGDFDGDGTLDVAVGTLDSGRAVAVLQGTGSGFVNRGTFPSGESELAAGDLNADGAAELVFVARPDFSIEGDDTRVGTLRLGDNGIELVSETYTVGLAWTITLADMTGDARLDLIVPGSSRGVMVMAGDGDGGFVPGDYVELEPGVGSYGAAAADLDGDGDLDLAISSGTEFGTFGDVGYISMLRNDGTGGLTVAQTGTTGGDPAGIALGDFDGDGVADVATARNLTGDVAVFEGRGDGTVTLPRSIPALARVGELHTGDFDADGHIDVAAISWSGQWSVALNDGSEFSLAPQDAAPFLASLAGEPADFDQDGNLDLIVTTSIVGPAAAVLYGDGSGTFGSAVEIPGPYSREVAVADMNGDGYPDAVIDSGYSPLLVAHSRADRTFETPIEVEIPPDSERIAIADVDGDGRPDILVATNKYLDPDPDAVYLIAQNTGGSYDAPVALVGVGNPTALGIADVDADGRLDMIVGRDDTPNALQISYGAGNGQFSAPISLAIELGPYDTASVRSLEVADVDADGDLDIVAGDDRHHILIYAQVAPRQLELSRSLPVVDYPWSLAVADLDGDGVPEIIAGDYNAAAVSFVTGGCP